jgi:hypothetical protein
LQIAKLLNEHLKKNAQWTWGVSEDQAFQELKKQICEELLLMQPDQMKPFKVKVDASNYAMGMVLMQKDNKGTCTQWPFSPKP